MSKLNFDEVRHDEHTAAHARCATVKHIGKDIFKPGTHSPALPLRATAGESQTAPFHTSSPHGEAKHYAHIALWRECDRFKCWGQIDRSWRVDLLRAGEVVYSTRDKGWHLVVNMVDGLSSLTLLMSEQNVSGYKVLTPCIGPNGMPYSWLCVFDDTDFHTHRIAHSGHAFRLLHDRLEGASHKTPIPAKDVAAPYIMLVGTPITLHVGDSLNAYNNIGIAQLRTYSREALLEMDSGADVFDFVEALMTHHLKGINAVSELDFIDILATRFEEKLDDDAAKHLPSSKDCEDGFGEEEIKVLDALQTSRAKAKTENSSSKKKLAKKEGGVRVQGQR